ncbi:hypothetical protein ACFVWX_13560 [Streptomyces sp. NPDC058220]|uniref:hypothetical protein n=1 Tax=Streptomyces sp. NPDC058220 TaxID=3346387 RepID=UPI0036EE9447
MSWFKIDDGFHCHAKVLAAGTPAVGLYVRCGSWAAQQASDGIVPKAVARMYGTPRMIKALVDADLWHAKGHECASCPELDANSYAIHQFLERNPSRVDIELERKAKSERQQRWREGKKKAEASEGNAANVDGDVDASPLRHGDAAPDPARPVPSPPSPTEKEQASRTRPTPPSTEGIPEQARPLVDGLTAAGVIVRWPFHGNEWFPLLALVSRTGVPAMVDHATKVASRTQVESAKYFLNGWSELPPLPPPGDGRPALRTVESPRPPLSPQATRRNESRNLLDNLAAQLRAGGTQ